MTFEVVRADDPRCAVLEADGYRVFGTGGAALNDASLGANLALGYVVTERWRSYAPPDGDGTADEVQGS